MTHFTPTQQREHAVAGSAWRAWLLTARFALATGAPAPRIMLHPASWTRSAQSQLSLHRLAAEGHLHCSLDGARFRSCGTSKGYGGLSDGRHVLLVQAQPVGRRERSDPVAWTVDYKAPKLAVSFVANDAATAARAGAGCRSTGGGCAGR